MRRIVFTVGAAAVLLLAAGGGVSRGEEAQPFGQAGPPASVKAVSIDPADYLSLEPDAGALARQLAASFEQNGVNLVYVNAYNVEYGAYYRTRYRFNDENDYGRQDFLGKLISAAHARGIRVAAALYDHQHRGAWEASPAWRAKTKAGDDYNPPLTDIQYYLSVAHPEFKTWWQGFLSDLLSGYPELDGVELREPIINWWGTTADYNPAMTRAFRALSPGSRLGGEDWRAFRQLALTRFLRDEIGLIHRAGRFVHVTTVADVEDDGRLIPPQPQARETGFDLYGLLAGEQAPDAVKVELIWQQWAKVHNYVVFTPEWTRRAVAEFLKQVDGLVPVIVHVELTDFGRHRLSADEFRRTLAAANLPSIAGMDFYSAFLADEKKGAWSAVQAVYRPHGSATEPVGAGKDRRALILYDEALGVPGSTPELSRTSAVYLANLLGHFRITWSMHRIEDYVPGELDEYDYLFYNASVYGNAPRAFINDVSVFDRTVVWLGENLFQLKQSGVRLPFEQPSQAAVSGFTRIQYGKQILPAKGDIIPTRPGRGAKVAAWMRGQAGSTPFVVTAGKFWYLAGSPFAFLDETNGRYLVFSDLLHEMLGEPHQKRHQALLRVEDVSPLTPPERLRTLADVFAQRKVNFAVAVIPFYADPATGVRVSLTDRPRLVAALRYMVRKGGSLVLHGSTHQYKGKTGVDYEFWDRRTLGGLPEDGEPYVRTKVERALAEAWANDLHPIAWETPHYSATPFDYALFAEYFSTFVERRIYGVWAGHDYQQALPFIAETDVYGGRIIPENLGYLRGEPGDLEALAAGAGALLVVRDAVAGAFLHPRTSPESVRALIDRFFTLGYTFIDLNDLPNLVQTPQRVELTGKGRAAVAVPSGFYLEERLIGRNGAELSSTLRRLEHYSRPTRSFNDVPHDGIFSLRAVPEEELSLSAHTRRGWSGILRLFETPSGQGPVASFGYFLGLGIAALAAFGLFLLFLAYLGQKIGFGRGATGL